MSDEKVAHVLIVDDDPTLRTLLLLILGEEGYKVAEAADGLAALEILRASPQRMVVLLDLRMPKMGGDGVLMTAERENQGLAEHIYVLVTANSSMIDPPLHELLQRLAVPIIAKPFETDKLLAAVRDATARLPQAS